MKADRKSRIVIAGAGVAGSLVAAGLMRREDVELVCLERAAVRDHAEAGTGLNIGPNALKCLKAHLPERADTLIANSLPWRSWSVALTDGRRLMDLNLNDAADNPGVRIRWAELYRLLRAPIADHVLFNTELIDCLCGPHGLEVTWRSDTGGLTALDGIDLLVGGDGRYSMIRKALFGAEEPSFCGVGLFRLLCPVSNACPIDDYGQWFNGPNRLLAFRVPGDFIYCAGSLPIPPDGEVPDAIKTADALRAAYMPAEGRVSPEVGWLLDAIERNVSRLHWARVQDGTIRYAHPSDPVLLVGDAAHPMVPTLGQGASQAIEDACVVVAEIEAALASGCPLATVPRRVEARRLDRIRFVVDFSREATDTMLAGADPVAGTLRKLEPSFQRKLARLYRDVPVTI